MDHIHHVNLITEHRFVCTICFEFFDSTDPLRDHYINHHDYKKQSENQSLKMCNICKMYFKSSKTLSKHIKSIHYKLKSFICGVCSKQFSRKATLDIHSRQHLSDESAKTLICPQEGCPFKTADPSILTKHKRLHQKTNEGKYKCPSLNCNFYAIQATGLKKHVEKKHPELYPDFKCKYEHCKFVSINKERIRRHYNDHEKGLCNVQQEERPKIEVTQNITLSSSMEISSDCSLPIEGVNSIDTGGVTIIHGANSNMSTNVHSEDTVF